MQRYKVTLAYNGAAYHGWQTQRKGRSVQEEVEIVLTTIHKEEIEVVASGRTDSKVHAMGQVMHFDSSIDMDVQGIQKAMNALLPTSIRVRQVEKVDANFHARFDATSKRYEYYLSKEPHNPFVQDFMGKVDRALAITAMQEAATVFVGEHDFTSFTSSKIDERKSRTKTIFTCTVEEDAKSYHFVLEGTGFLRYMVRMIVQTLIEVGKGNLTVEEVKTMLYAKCKHACKYKADPQGLYLVEVHYEGKE